MKRMVRKNIKNLLVQTPGFLALAAWYTRYTPKIFMMHRFSQSSDENNSVMTGAIFEKQLRYLKRGKWNVITLNQYIAMRKKCKQLPPYLVILTIDDGYRDFYHVAYPLLKKYDFNATFFVTTKFIDGNFWLWHDRINYALRKSDNDYFEIEFEGNKRFFFLRNEDEIRSTWQVFSDYCISIPDTKKWDTISSLESTLRVTIPKAVAPEYAAASWRQLCEMQGTGIEIGSHSCSHPILSKITPEKLEQEISGSKKLIEEKLNVPIESFCYPNGRKEDINAQVIDHVKKAGYCGAPHGCNLDFSNVYKLPRMGIGSDMVDFYWKISGMEMLLNNYDC